MKPDSVVDITDLFEDAGVVDHDQPGVAEVAIKPPTRKPRFPAPDPLGILGRISGGVIYDPLKSIFAGALAPAVYLQWQATVLRWPAREPDSDITVQDGSE